MKVNEKHSHFATCEMISYHWNDSRDVTLDSEYMSDYSFRKANAPSSIQLWSKCSYTPSSQKACILCSTRHLRAEKGMHPDQDNLVLRIMLQETTPVTGALRV